MFRVCIEDDFLYRRADCLIRAVNTAIPTARAAHALCEFRAHPFHVLPSGFWFLNGERPADPFIAQEASDSPMRLAPPRQQRGCWVSPLAMRGQHHRKLHCWSESYVYPTTQEPLSQGWQELMASSMCLSSPVPNVQQWCAHVR